MTSVSMASRPVRFRYLPGLCLTAGIAAAADLVHRLPGATAFSPAIVAAVFGLILAHTMRVPTEADEGISVSTRLVLRIAVALLGLQVTIGQVVTIGWRGFIIAAAGLTTSFLFIRWLGAKLGVEQRLATLIAGGTSICGASAVAGINAVTGAEEEDAAYAVALVTVFGTLAMLIYPWLGHALGLTPRTFGLWAGASIHEVAQVAGAAAQVGPEAEQYGAIAKLTRVMLLAPLVLVLQMSGRPAAGTRRHVGIPLFVLGFVALMILASLVTIPFPIKAATGQVSAFLLAMALGGMGLKTHVSDLRAKGLAPFVLGAAGSLFISLLTLGLVNIPG